MANPTPDFGSGRGVQTLSALAGIAPVPAGAMTPGAHVAHLPLPPSIASSDPNIGRDVDYWIYLVCIAKKRFDRDVFEVRRPPLYPCLHLKKCEPDSPYVISARLPDTVTERWVNDQGEMGSRGYRGERIATDILNPSNLSNDCWQEVPESSQWLDDGGSDDLTKRGMFWTLSETPAAEDLARCKERMERHYRRLISSAEQLYIRGQGVQNGWIGPEMHLAADYFRVKSAWHQVAVLPESCPNCGEEIRPGIAFHAGPFGICVIDEARAVAALGKNHPAFAGRFDAHEAKAKAGEKAN